MRFNTIIAVRQESGLQREARWLAFQEDRQMVMVQWLDTYLVEWIPWNDKIVEWTEPEAERTIAEQFQEAIDAVAKMLGVNR